ncbi:hypothetical protein BH11PLA2_BH11PLA2_27850 [soil metagenome]
MKMTYSKVLEAAMALGKNDRRKLREQLNVNLDPSPIQVDSTDGDIDESRLMHEDMTEEEVIAELNRRHEEYLRDPSCAIPAEEFEREMRSMFK